MSLRLIDRSGRAIYPYTDLLFRPQIVGLAFFLPRLDGLFVIHRCKSKRLVYEVRIDDEIGSPLEPFVHRELAPSGRLGAPIREREYHFLGF